MDLVKQLVCLRGQNFVSFIADNLETFKNQGSDVDVLSINSEQYVHSVLLYSKLITFISCTDFKSEHSKQSNQFSVSSNFIPFQKMFLHVLCIIQQFFSLNKLLLGFMQKQNKLWKLEANKTAINSFNFLFCSIPERSVPMKCAKV